MIVVSVRPYSSSAPSLPSLSPLSQPPVAYCGVAHSRPHASLFSPLPLFLFLFQFHFVSLFLLPSDCSLFVSFSARFSSLSLCNSLSLCLTLFPCSLPAPIPLPHLPPLPFPDMAIRLISVLLRRSGFFIPSLVSRQEQRSCDIALFCYINKTKHFTGDTPWVKNENSNRFTLKKYRYLNGYPAKHRHRNVSYRLVVDQTQR